MKELNVGFIGYGRHAKANLYPVLKLLDQPMQAICTTSKKSSEQGKLEQNAKASYTDHKEMLEKEDLDCVFISTEPDAQADLTIDCLNAGVHVFVEKPPGLSLEKAKKVAEASKKTGKHVMVGYMKRFAPNYVELKNVIENDKFGDLISVSGMFGCRNFVTDGKQYLLFAAIHYADMLIHLMGEMEEVKGFENVEGESISQTITCKSKSGVTASMIFIASPAWAKLNEELYVSGTAGFAHVQNSGNLDYHFTGAKSEKPGWQLLEEETIVKTSVLTTGSGGNQDFYQRGFVGEVEHFLECVREDKEPLTSAEENLKTMEFVYMILDAIK